jgi:hypothetical protein
MGDGIQCETARHRAALQCISSLRDKLADVGALEGQ